MVHRLDKFYQNLYILGRRISKRDRFGIHVKSESLCLEAIELALTATLEEKTKKIEPLNILRIKIEIIKRLARICLELKIIDSNKYLELIKELEEISKMTNGWLKYLNK